MPPQQSHPGLVSRIFDKTMLHWTANVLIIYILPFPLIYLFHLGSYGNFFAAFYSVLPESLSVIIFLVVLPIVALFTLGELVGKRKRKERFTGGDWYRAIGLLIPVVTIIIPVVLVILHGGIFAQ